MIEDGPQNGFGFLIDTDSYAGNFEREMTAYLTGQIGECEVGSEMVEELPFSKSFNSNVQQVADDNGCYRPTSCWMEPSSGSNNSVAIFFYEKPSQEEIEFLKDRANGFNDAMGSDSYYKPINILGFRLVEFKQTQTEISI